MDDSEVYNNISMEITLNVNGYSGEEVNQLMIEPFHTLYTTKVSYQWFPSVLDNNSLGILIAISFALSNIGSGFWARFGEDIYNWGKNSLSKIFNKGNDFEESYLTIKFEDIIFSIPVRSKKEMMNSILAIKDMLPILKEYALNKDENNCVEIKYENIKKWIH